MRVTHVAIESAVWLQSIVLRIQSFALIRFTVLFRDILGVVVSVTTIIRPCHIMQKNNRKAVLSDGLFFNKLEFVVYGVPIMIAIDAYQVVLRNVRERVQTFCAMKVQVWSSVALPVRRIIFWIGIDDV